ncbi:hypothetical protein BJ170DRAFT_687251 [Xylariales sp. AK1849]|nr:hypothetical protein BJ170DRAFT_687251 [Xylariales sp. AK1849]
MARGYSVITDQRRCAPTPGTNLKFNGRRPHQHGDRESHYVEERIESDPRVRGETSESAVLHTRALPKLAAYPGREFDYAHQNRRGNDPQGDAGYNRIVTDPRKNQLGLSYHPLGSRDKKVRADMQGGFVADYRRDSIEHESEKQKYAATGNRSSTWPQR